MGQEDALGTPQPESMRRISTFVIKKQQKPLKAGAGPGSAFPLRRTEAGRWERSTLLRPSCFYYTMAQQPKQTGSFLGFWEHFPQRFLLQRVDLGIFGGFCCADAGPAAFSTPWRSTGLVRGAQIVLPPRQLPFAQPTLMQRSQI